MTWLSAFDYAVSELRREFARRFRQRAGNLNQMTRIGKPSENLWPSNAMLAMGAQSANVGSAGVQRRWRLLWLGPA